MTPNSAANRYSSGCTDFNDRLSELNVETVNIREFDDDDLDWLVNHLEDMATVARRLQKLHYHRRSLK